jgi:hypothetical protein
MRYLLRERMAAYIILRRFLPQNCDARGSRSGPCTKVQYLYLEECTNLTPASETRRCDMRATSGHCAVALARRKTLHGRDEDN